MSKQLCRRLSKSWNKVFTKQCSLLLNQRVIKRLNQRFIKRLSQGFTKQQSGRLVFALGVLILSFAASAMTKDDRETVSSTGECLRKSEPDRGEVFLGIRALEKDADKAARRATDVYESLRNYVRKMNLKEIELSTSQLTIYEEKEWINNSNVFKGFRAAMGLTVSTSDISKLGEIVTKATGLGANDVQSMRVFLSSEKLMREKRECLEAAVLDARSKAEGMAKALGRKIGSAVLISERSENPTYGNYEMASMAMSDGGAKRSAPVIETKPIEVRNSVQVTFELK